ncbi:MAG TPA: glycosyltransferase family 2 protein [Anaerolineae bacterium]|nr:glycosyltransferase family 2 protein [Anaerolineae bacterium]
MSDAVDLSIVIVSWNVRELLRVCLQTVDGGRGELALEVIVVDGGSVDGSAAMVAAEFPWVKLIARPDNVGFPKGNNIGIAEAGGRHILLLNPDTELIGEALTTMVDYLDRHQNVGGVGAQLLNPDGSVQSSRRRFPTVVTGLVESTWLQPWAPSGVLAHYFAEDLADDEINEVDWVVGACLMVPRRVVAEVGDLDVGYFMYSEELDWCRRIKDGGWQIVYLPTAQVVHHVGKSSEQAVTARHINFQRAKLRYFRKYYGWVVAWGLRLFLLLNYGWQMVIEGLKGLVGHKRPLRWQRVQAYWHVIKTGLPPAGY